MEVTYGDRISVLHYLCEILKPTKDYCPYIAGSGVRRVPLYGDVTYCCICIEKLIPKYSCIFFCFTNNILLDR